MALKNNFYQDMNIKEQKWIELIENNLLNIYYFEAELNPFYRKKLEELEYEYNLTGNKIIGQIIEEIKSIVKKLEELENSYRNGNNVDIKTILPLFLINKFNNNIKEENTNISKIQTQKELLQQLKNNYVVEVNKKEEDYIYEDFPEDLKTK